MSPIDFFKYKKQPDIYVSFSFSICFSIENKIKIRQFKSDPLLMDLNNCFSSPKYSLKIIVQNKILIFGHFIIFEYVNTRVLENLSSITVCW